MIKINTTYVDRDILTAQFHCLTTACRSACCIEGDIGAPLRYNEAKALVALTAQIKHHLTAEAQQYLSENPPVESLGSRFSLHTACSSSGACIYFNPGTAGSGGCSLQLLESAKIPAPAKPISCRLYPLRLNRYEGTRFHHLTYVKAKMCSSARHHGQEGNTYLIEYLRQPITTALGIDFYNELLAIAKQARKGLD